MKTIISFGDFIDLYFKLESTKPARILSRLTPSSSKTRTIKAWNKALNIAQTNWWSIPLVQKRWNQFITGNENIGYSAYLTEKYLKNKIGLVMLSPGCGTGGKELKFASIKVFSLIEAFDISANRISIARENAKGLGLENINYSVSDVTTFNFGSEKYDVVLFDSFLHHIKDLEGIINKIYISLKQDGILIINEYVGPSRFQWRKEQLKTANKALASLPVAFRKRLKTEKVKTKIYRPGLLRMIISDPSEAVCSENILSKVRERFKVLEEKPYGGNILHLTLKDISHNFIDGSEESIRLLNDLFSFEDDFLSYGNLSDFVFGVYSK